MLLRIWAPQIKREGRRVMRPWYLGALKCHAIRPNQGLHLWRTNATCAFHHFIDCDDCALLPCTSLHDIDKMHRCKHAKMQRHKHTDVADAQTTGPDAPNVRAEANSHTHTHTWRWNPFPPVVSPHIGFFKDNASHLFLERTILELEIKLDQARRSIDW